jgi:hypothetical protein
MRDESFTVGDRVRISDSAARDFKVKDWAYNMPGVVQELGDFGGDPSAVIKYANGLTSFSYVANLEFLDPARAAVPETVMAFLKAYLTRNIWYDAGYEPSHPNQEYRMPELAAVEDAVEETWEFALPDVRTLLDGASPPERDAEAGT